MILEIETQDHDRACCRPLMVMDSDKGAQSSVNYHLGYEKRHPLIPVSNDCTVFLHSYRFLCYPPLDKNETALHCQEG